MVEHEVVVSNALGLHARAAAKLVKLASNFSSSIYLKREDTGVDADARSILSLLYIAAAKGVRLKITACGEDESEAMDQVLTLFRAGFGEEN